MGGISVDLHGCKNITDAGLEHVGNLLQLTYLNLHYALEEIVIHEAESDVQPIQDITHKYVNRMSLGDVGVNAFIDNPEYNADDPNSLHKIVIHDCNVKSFVRDCRRPIGNGSGFLISESDC